MMRRRSIVLSAALGPLASPGIFAQNDKPLRILVGFAAGSGIDVSARYLGERLSQVLKQPVIVENRPGAGGQVAAAALKAAQDDGQTLLYTPMVVPVLAPMVFSKLPYDPEKDLLPVGHVCNFYFGLAVRNDFPAQNLKEMLAWLKNNPQQAAFGSPAIGGLPHFFGLLIGREAGLSDFLHVPLYNTSVTLPTAVMGGQVPLGIDVTNEWVQLARGGKVRILATSGPQRSKVVPDVPTFVEQGFPGIVGGGWFAMYASSKTTPANQQRINEALNQVLAQPDVPAKLISLGYEPGGGSVNDLAQLAKADSRRWAPVVQASGVRVN